MTRVRLGRHRSPATPIAPRPCVIGAAARRCARSGTATALLAALLAASTPAVRPAPAGAAELSVHAGGAPASTVPRPAPLCRRALGWRGGPAGPAASDDSGAGDHATTQPATYRFPAADDRGYDVQHYDLDLVIDPALQRVDGRVAITLQAIAPVQVLRVDLVDELPATSLTWSAGAEAPRPVAFTQAGDSLRAELPVVLSAGDRGVLTVTYGGRPPRHGPFQAGLLFRTQGSGPDDPQAATPVVASISEPYSSHAWWPCKDHPHDKATLRLAVTAPDTLEAVSNGRLESTAPASPGALRWTWSTDHPIATYLVSVAISRYASWHQRCDGAGVPVPLDFHAFPADSAAAAVDLAPTCAMMEFLAGILGPYPFADEKYAQVMVVAGVAGMENQTATALARWIITGDRTWESVVLHELAHSWFGNSITPARWRDVWLNEGFARYAEALWVEHRHGAEGYRAFMHGIGPAAWPDLFVGAGLLGDPAPPVLSATGLLVYDKGAWLLHMLRGHLGDERFFAALRAYAGAPELQGGNATTSDFVRLASAAAGEDVGPFLAPWLQTQAVPVLEVTRRQTRRDDGTELAITVRQLQDPMFPLRLPLRVHRRRAAAVDSTVLLTARETRLVWQVPGRVSALEVDPDGWVLHRIATAPPPLLEPLPAAPNPCAGGALDLRWWQARPARLTLSLHDARGRRLAGWDLGEVAAAPAGAGGEPARWTIDLDGTDRLRLASGAYWMDLRADSGEHAVIGFTILR
ncbi:MAG: M1 family metallopeptidase [Candidatus Krumholzibacteriia bacterium]